MQVQGYLPTENYGQTSEMTFLLSEASVAPRGQRISHLADVGGEKDPHELVLALEVTGHQGEGGGCLRAIPLLETDAQHGISRNLISALCITNEHNLGGRQKIRRLTLINYTLAQYVHQCLRLGSCPWCKISKLIIIKSVLVGIKTTSN